MAFIDIHRIVHSVPAHPSDLFLLALDMVLLRKEHKLLAQLAFNTLLAFILCPVESINSACKVHITARNAHPAAHEIAPRAVACLTRPVVAAVAVDCTGRELATLDCAAENLELSPLLRAALDNTLDSGDAALTGPVVRGDVETVRTHLDEIAAHAPGTLPSYLALARATLDRVAADGRVGPDRADAVRRVLDEAGAGVPRTIR